MNRQLIQAIESALPAMPSVLAVIIASYGCRHRHRFSISHTEATDWRINSAGASETEVRYVGPPLLLAWHRFASTANIVDGAASWTVQANLTGYVAAGVTTKPDDYATYGGMPAPAGTWSIRLRDGLMVIYGDKRSDRPIGPAAYSSIRFFADAATKSITATVGTESVVLMTANSSAEFRLLRPCVVLGDTTVVTLISESSSD